MTKRQLIKEIHLNTSLRYVDVEDVVNQVFEKMASAIENDDKVTINGFGTFEKAEQPGYIGVNPNTGEKMEVKPFKKIRFTTGKTLKNRINEN